MEEYNNQSNNTAQPVNNNQQPQYQPQPQYQQQPQPQYQQQPQQPYQQPMQYQQQPYQQQPYQQQPQYQQAPQNVNVCPKCGGVMAEKYKTWQIVVAVLFFPIGMLSLLAGKSKKCTRCGQWEV